MQAQTTTTDRTLGWTGALGFLLALTAAVAIPAVGMPQWLTGPLVNALLIGTVLWLGVPQAVMVGLLTPLGAAVRGVLPLPMVVMIPFIAMGNATLVTVFGALRARNEWLALGVAAVAKFALLFAAVTLLIARPVSLGIAGGAQVVSIPAAMADMMRWPQLVTALTGGLLVLGGKRLLRRRG